MTIRTEQDIIGMKQASEAAAKTLRLMKAYCAPGMTTRDVDQYGGEIIKSCGARSAPILAYRFPGFTCISVNEVAAHGIPSSNKVLKNGDLVNIDVSVELDGYWSDNGCSFILGEDYFHLSDLVNASKTILKEAINLICHNYKISKLRKRRKIKQRTKIWVANAAKKISRVNKVISKLSKKRPMFTCI